MDAPVSPLSSRTHDGRVALGHSAQSRAATRFRTGSAARSGRGVPSARRRSGADPDGETQGGWRRAGPGRRPRSRRCRPAGVVPMARLTAQGLDVDGHVLVEVDRVENAPVIHPGSLLGPVQPVGSDHLGQTETGHAELRVSLAWDVEVPRSSEVVLGAGAGAGDGGVGAVLLVRRCSTQAEDALTAPYRARSVRLRPPGWTRAEARSFLFDLDTRSS